MTACTMSSDYGMEFMLGTSPVLTSGFHAATSSGLFSDYSRCGSSPGLCWDSGSPQTKSPNYYSADALVEQFSDLTTSDRCRTYARTGSLRRSRKLDRLKKEFAQNKPLLSINPAKSCLRQIDEQSQQEDSTALTSPTKEKKKVCFADAFGHKLEQVKLIMEKPDCPPLWSNDFIEKVTGGISPTESPTKDWEVTFAQPVSDYINFKNRVERENVCLENVVLQHKKSGTISGTVLVRNLSFCKDVLVRYTINNWATTTDCNATYLPSVATSSAYDLYDKFAFEFPLPHLLESDKVEFCIRYTSDGMEYWDNNGGRNYTIISFRAKNNGGTTSTANQDAYHMDMNNWSVFASWNSQPGDETPYW